MIRYSVTEVESIDPGKSGKSEAVNASDNGRVPA